MRKYLLLSCTAFSMYSSWGAVTMSSHEEEAAKSSHPTRSFPYQHDPYKAVPRKYVKASKIPILTQEEFNNYFALKVGQFQLCITSSDYYPAAIQHINDLQQTGRLSESDKDKLLKIIQIFANKKGDTLKQTTPDSEGNLLKEYAKVSRLICHLVQTKLFSIETTEKLKCYLVTFLIGMAFVSRSLSKDAQKIKYAQMALEVITSITQETVISPYGDNRSFNKANMQAICHNIINDTYDPLKTHLARLNKLIFRRVKDRGAYN